MKRSKAVQLEHYRGYQIETRDLPDGGWVVSISSWEGVQPTGTVLRSDSPLALAGLLSMARERVDAALALGDAGVPVQDSKLGQRLNRAGLTVVSHKRNERDPGINQAHQRTSHVDSAICAHRRHHDIEAFMGRGPSAGLHA